jgi:hypothetical protein
MTKLPLAAVVCAALYLTSGAVAGDGAVNKQDNGFSTSLSYRLSLRAGTRDANGKLITGTEIMHLVTFRGRLYAANDLWMEQDSSVPKACQLLVLDKPDGAWRIERQFGNDNLRLTALKVVRFATDGAGKAITPISLLLAAPDESSAGEVRLHALGEDGAWVEMPLGTAARYSTTRSFGFHRDAKTGVDSVFAGNSTLGFLRGFYDAGAPGGIRWATKPEFEVPAGERVMGFCEANGLLYAATTRWIVRRRDGPDASWEKVFNCPEEVPPVGIRGLSATPRPGGGEWLLFAARRKVHHLDPLSGDRDEIELDMPAFLSKLWGFDVAGVLAAYNDFYPLSLPTTGERVELFGFETTIPPRSRANATARGFRFFVSEKQEGAHYAAEGRFFIRHSADGRMRYEVETIDAPDQTLVGVRTIAASPFPSEPGVLYFGGFDCNSQPSHHSAWIYRGEWIRK